MGNSIKRDALFVVAIIATAAAVFCVDLMLELGVAGGVAYVGVVCLAYWGRDRSWIWFVAAGCCVLTLLGYYLSPPGGEAWKVVINRALALFAIGVTATLCDAAERVHERLQQSEHELQHRVEERTAELVRSTAELDFAFTAALGESDGRPEKSAIVPETGEELSGSATFDDMLDAWARQARNLIGAHQSAVSYVPRGDFSKGKHAISLSDKYEKYRTYDVLPTGDGIWSVAMMQRFSFCLTDEQLKSHPAWKNFSDLRDERGLEHPPMRGWLAVPILSREQDFVGLLQLSDKFEGDFTQDDLQQLTRLAQLMAPSLSLQYANEELHQAMDELRLANQTLVQSNSELQQFAHSASHDLQEPLRSIAGFCQLLQRRYKGRLDPEADEWIEYAVQAAIRMRALVEDLLTYSHLDTQVLPFSEVDLSKVVDEAVANLSKSIEESGADVTRDELPTVLGDRSQLLQVMQNLIGNGIKFHDDKRPQVHVSAQRKGDNWIFAVRDNGLGIPADKLESIFEIFRRLHTQQQYPGTGIGLAICRRIAERHRGKMWVDSELGKGSTFYFALGPGNEA